MKTDQDSRITLSRKACFLALLWFCIGPAASAQNMGSGCIVPVVPFVPADPSDRAEYIDLLKRDFEEYFGAVSAYFRCLENERERAFSEAQQATQAYGELLAAPAE